MNFTRRQTLSLAAAASVAGLAGGLPTVGFAKDGDQLDQLKLMVPAGIPDKVSGDPNAKVTVIEYASPTCPHCALFANTVLAAFEDKYVKTGKVRFILRPFARNTMDAAIFMLAEAAAKSADGISLTASTDAQNGQASSSSSSSAEAASNQGAMSPPPAPGGTASTPGYSPNAVAAAENVISTFFKTQDNWGLSDKPLDAVKAVAFQLGFSEQSFNQALQDQDFFNKIQSMRDQAMNEFGLEGTPTFYINGKQLSGEKTLDQLSAEIDPLL